MHLSLDLTPRCHIDAAHFRKLNRPSLSERVEFCIKTTVLKFWNGIVQSYINMFKPSCNRDNARS